MENEVMLNSTVETEMNEEDRSFAMVISFIRRFFLLILIITLLGAGAGFGYAYTRDKTVYTQSKSVILLAKITANKQQATSLNNLTLSKKYIPTVQAILTTDIFIAEANSIAKERNVGFISSYWINVEEVSGTILKISYSDFDKDAAANKLDVFLQAAQDVIQHGGFDGKSLLTADAVDFKPIDNVPVTTSSNGMIKYILLGLLGGMVLGIAIAFLIYLLDNGVRNKDDLERLTGSTVIAYLEDMDKPAKSNSKKQSVKPIKSEKTKKPKKSKK